MRLAARAGPAADFGAHGLPTNNVRSIYQTRDGALWFGTWRAGAVRWPPAATDLKSQISDFKSSPRRYTTADGLADDAVLEWRAGGFRSGVGLVSHYVRPDKLDRFAAYHVRVRFSHPVRGPLAVGAGRYRGFGLFAAEGGP